MRKARSKSEYKRLTAQGVKLVAPVRVPIKLIKWEVVATGGENTCLPPEAEDTQYPTKVRLAGEEIITSRILTTEGRIVRTLSSLYELVGPPSEKYTKWCEDNGIVIDPVQPVKFRHISDPVLVCDAAECEPCLGCDHLRRDTKELN
jgi:hypothetical protein